MKTIETTIHSTRMTPEEAEAKQRERWARKGVKLASVKVEQIGQMDMSNMHPNVGDKINVSKRSYRIVGEVV